MLFWMLLNCSATNHPRTVGGLLLLFTVYNLCVCSYSSSGLQYLQTQASILSREYSRSVYSTSYTKAIPSSLADFGSGIRQRSSTFATQVSLGICEVADGRTELFFNVFGAPNSTVPRTFWSCFEYGKGSTIKRLSISWWSSSGMRPLKTYLELQNFIRIFCTRCEHSSRATFFKTLKIVCKELASSNVKKLAAISPALPEMCFLRKVISIQCTTVLEPSVTKDGPVVETLSSF